MFVRQSMLSLPHVEARAALPENSPLSFGPGWLGARDGANDAQRRTATACQGTPAPQSRSAARCTRMGERRRRCTGHVRRPKTASRHHTGLQLRQPEPWLGLILRLEVWTYPFRRAQLVLELPVCGLLTVSDHYTTHDETRRQRSRSLANLLPRPVVVEGRVARVQVNSLANIRRLTTVLPLLAATENQLNQRLSYADGPSDDAGGPSYRCAALFWP